MYLKRSSIWQFCSDYSILYKNKFDSIKKKSMGEALIKLMENIYTIEMKNKTLLGMPLIQRKPSS